MSNRIYIVGIGPGREEMMTGEAIAALEQADVIVGYTVYVKLLGERFAGKKLLTTPMRQETERCELCFREAGGIDLQRRRRYLRPGIADV